MTDRQPSVRAALYYGSDAHDAGRERLMGMQVANAGFLSAVLAHAAPGPVSIHTSDAEAFAEFRRRFPSPRETRLIPFHDVSSLAGPGCLMLPGPALARHARLRRYAGCAFALCGVTHAMASERALDADVGRAHRAHPGGAPRGDSLPVRRDRLAALRTCCVGAASAATTHSVARGRGRGKFCATVRTR